MCIDIQNIIWYFLMERSRTYNKPAYQLLSKVKKWRLYSIIRLEGYFEPHNNPFPTYWPIYLVALLL